MMSLSQLLTGTGVRGGAGDAALSVLRVFAGIAFIMHGWGKVTDVGGFSAAHGVPVVLGAAAAYGQFIGGILQVFGLLTPPAALGIGLTMVVAVGMLIRARIVYQPRRAQLGKCGALRSVNDVLCGARRRQVLARPRAPRPEPQRHPCRFGMRKRGTALLTQPQPRWKERADGQVA